MEHDEKTFGEIMDFYYKLLCVDDIPSGVRSQMLFYGGTVPYAVAGAQGGAYRKFGDVDIHVPVDTFASVRGAITGLREFEMQDNFKAEKPIGNATLPHRSTTPINPNAAEPCYATPPNSYNQLPNATTPINPNVTESRSTTLDYGFAGKLHGIDISVAPIYEHNNCIMARTVSTGSHGDFFVDRYKLMDYPLGDLTVKQNIFGCDINTFANEYTLLTKLRSIRNGLKYRAEKDGEDIRFIHDNIHALNITPKRIIQIAKRLPNNNVICAHKIDGGKIVGTYNAREYKELCDTRTH
jgi:hypothetical protein